VTLAELGSKTSFDHIERHARETPDRIAITGPERQVSWARFRADAGRFAQALDKLGIEPGQIAAISHPDRYIHWLLVIACETIGAVSASFAAGDPADDAAHLLRLADLVLTDRPVPGCNQHLLTEGWIAGVLAQTGAGQHRRHPATPDAPLRIARTSGSTGTPKCMVIKRRMQAYWIASMAAYNFNNGPATRFYAAYPLSVNPSYYRIEACLRLGATIIFGHASQDLVTFEATHCWLLPRDMVALLQGVRGAWPSARPLHMILSGGPVSAALHDQTAALLGTEVRIVYGANEIGGIGLQDRDGVGTVLPEIDFKIVDEDGRALPAGVPGTIAIRSPGLVEGYLNDPETTRAFFAQGRFLTDDIGVLLADGRFRIIGRRSEIINLGGVKLSPAPIEEGLRADIAGIRDVAVTALPNPQGIDEICVAVVPDASADPSALLNSVRAALDPSFGWVWLLALKQLPLTASGKVQRSAVKEIFAAMRPR